MRLCFSSMRLLIFRQPIYYLIGFAAFTAMILVNYATPAGAGLANDSTAYIAGARSILNGTGYSDIWLLPPYEPITHYPPLYSIFLAFVGSFHIDPLRGSRILNMVLFGANTFLVGLLVWRTTHKTMITLWAVILFEFGAMFLRTHVYAMSEALFLTMMLSALVLTVFYAETKKSLWLVLAGGFSGLAILTRYSGLALIPPIMVGSYFLQKNWRDQVRSILSYIIPVFVTILPWFARNSLIAGNVTNRSLRFHPITRGNIDLGIYNLSRMFIPIESLRQVIFKSGWWDWMLAVGFIFLCCLALRAFIKMIRSKEINESSVISFLLLALFATYFLAVFFSMSFFDNSTKLQDRIIAPGYLALILFLAASANSWLGKDQRFVRIGLVALALITIFFTIQDILPEVRNLRAEGLGYANWKYRANPIIEELADLPEEITIFTNSPPAVYLTTGRAVQVLPTSIDPVSNTPRGSYESKLEQMSSEIENGGAVLALFNLNDLESTEEYSLIEPLIERLSVVKKGGDAVLFSK